MKRFLIFIIFIIFSLCSIKTFANSDVYTYVWSNTYIKIEVGSDLQNYINLPKATLYKNGKATDETVVYLKGDNATDESTINTSIIGKYELAYTAISLIEEKVIVTFDVCDTTAPKIKQVAGINLNVGCNKEDAKYDTYFNITDFSGFEVDYIDSSVNYNKVGIYDLTVSATDKHGNNRSGVYYVSISDVSGPEITQKKVDLKINYGDKYDVLKYFEAIDRVDGNCSSNLTSTTIDTTKLGYQTVKLTAYDYEDNHSYASFEIEVVDSEAPKIKLSNNVVELSVGNLYKINKDYFLSYVESVTDNCKDLNITNIEVDISDIKTTIGTYKVIYSVTDDYENSTFETLFVTLICDSVPQIETKEITCKVGDSINYYHYISVYDTYDGDITLEATIDSSSVNLNKKGIYFANVVVKNSYGKYNYATITVHVKNTFLKGYWYVFAIPLGIFSLAGYIIYKYKMKDKY